MAVSITGSSQASSGSSVSSITSAITLAADTNLLIVAVNNYWTSTTPTPTGVTYNGVSLISLGSVNNNFFGSGHRVELFYLENPSVGIAYNLIASWSNVAQDMGFTWAAFSGYGSLGAFTSNSSPLNNISSNPTLTLADWTSGAFAFGELDIGSAATVNNIPLGTYVSASQNSEHVYAEYSTSSGSLGWTNAGEGWAAAGICIFPSASIITGTITDVQQPDISSITGSIEVSGTEVAIQNQNTDSLNGSVLISANLTDTQNANIANASGSIAISGSQVVIQAKNIEIASGQIAISGSSANIQLPNIGYAIGNTTGQIDGTMASVQNANIAHVSGLVQPVDGTNPFWKISARSDVYHISGRGTHYLISARPTYWNVKE